MLRIEPEIPTPPPLQNYTVRTPKGSIVGKICIRTLIDYENGEREVERFSFVPNFDHSVFWSLGEVSLGQIVEAIRTLNKLHNI